MNCRVGSTADYHLGSVDEEEPMSPSTPAGGSPLTKISKPTPQEGKHYFVAGELGQIVFAMNTGTTLSLNDLIYIFLKVPSYEDAIQGACIVRGNSEICVQGTADSSQSPLPPECKISVPHLVGWYARSWFQAR